MSHSLFKEVSKTLSQIKKRREEKNRRSTEKSTWNQAHHELQNEQYTVPEFIEQVGEK